MAETITVEDFDQIPAPERELHLAVGMFDGVHLGHQALIESAVHSAGRSGGCSGVLTFWPHPSKLFRPEQATPQILTQHAKVNQLEKLGVDLVINRQFTAEFAALGAETFLSHLKMAIPGLKAIYVGSDFRFGKGRTGNVDTLVMTGKACGVDVFSIQRIRHNDQDISSTRIREMLGDGRMKDANELLGYTYFCEGPIMGGRKLGRTIGFPTLNLRWEPELKPRFGVYAVEVWSDKLGEPVPGVANYGLRPTVNKTEQAPLLETHVLAEDCPLDEGDSIKVTWLSFIRAEQKFDSVDELKAQISRDAEAARKFHQMRS